MLLLFWFVEFIGQFFGLLFIAQFEFEFAFFGAEDDRLAFHATDHVKGSARLAAQGHLQEIFFDACLNSLAQLGLDLKETIGRTESVDPLIGAFVVVIFDPELDPLAGVVERIELGATEKVLPESAPEPFDLAQSHGMLRTALEVFDAVLFQLRFEPGSATPGGVLAPVVGEHLAGRLVLAHSDAVNFDDRGRGRTAKEIRCGDEAGVIIQEGDQISVLAAEAESKDIRLPHLIGRGPLEKARADHVPLFGFGSRIDQASLMELLPNGFWTGLEKESPAQPLGDAFDAKRRVGLLERQNFFGDRRGQLWLAQSRWRVGLQPLLAVLVISPNPA